MKEEALEYVSEAILTYGNPTIKAELQSLDRQSPVRHQMLIALGTTIRDYILQYATTTAVSSSSTSTSSRTSHSPLDNVSTRQQCCPIYKALVEMNIPVSSMPSEEQLQEQRQIVSQWGRPLPHPFWSKLVFEEQARHFYEAKKLERGGDGTSASSSGSHTSSMKTTTSSSSKSKQQPTDANKIFMRFTNHSVVKQGSSWSFLGENGMVDWSKLQKINISDLKLFECCKGCILEGTLVTDTFTPMVGTTTLLEDGQGNIVKICLYNFLPPGVSENDADLIGKKMLPKDSKVKILEPFYKIFKDGSRGIRIDDPNDIQVILPKTTKQPPSTRRSHKKDNNQNHKDITREDQEEMLLLGKQEANRLFEKKLYFAASESYIQLLRGDDGFISTLLSNRSQASIQLGDWTEALCDAAASLTLQPDFKKSWKRYWKAMAELGIVAQAAEQGENMQQSSSSQCQDSEKLKHVLLLIFSSTSLKRYHGQELEKDAPQNNSSAQELKAKGNDAFKSGDFDKARQFYSLALQSAGGTTRAILSNWSQCAMNLNIWHDAIAAAAASLRIFPQMKSVYRLAKALILIGEPKISVAVLGKYSDIVKENNALFRKLVSDANVIASNDYNIQQGLHNCSDLVSNWVGKIETFQTQGKGRGVRALEDIPPGQMVLVERPIISYHWEVTDYFMGSSTGVNDFDDGSSALIKTAAVNRAQRDGVFASIMNRLYDGSVVPPLVPFRDLFLAISSANLLLPSHHEYLPETKRINMTPDRISGIISRNSHGIRRHHDCADKRYFQNDKELGYSELYPGGSMFNHSKNPNCDYAKFGDKPYQCILTQKAVRKGEELTVRYHSDEEVVQRCWLKP